ncbi:MAG TPA: DUF1501 domain-containing protein [Acidimicrobiales bacterium]|nr:DUF1501 domain-containing protein [Acidimicrobiales bacterium]
MTISRRQFLTAAGAGVTAPVWLRLGGLVEDAAFAAPVAPSRLLLTIFLGGGNDGLNTVAPYLDPQYQRIRPNLALRESEVLPIGGGLGLHSSLASIHERWTKGQVAVVQRVGYAKPNFSHFASANVWDTGSPVNQFASGWLGRYLDRTDNRSRGAVRALAVADSMPLTISGDRVSGVAARTLGDFALLGSGPEADLRRQALVDFGAGGRDASMRSTVVDWQQRMLQAVTAIGQLSSSSSQTNAAETIVTAFAGGLGTEVGYLTLGSYDTHTDQRWRHAANLKMLDDTVKAFFNAAEAKGVASRAAVLVVSEFGRRGPENAAGGTDHGAGGPVFLIGPTVKGGVYGDRADLSRLDDGNVPAAFDLRSVYASVLEQHLDAAAGPILGGTFGQLPLFTTAKVAPATPKRARR